MTKKLKRLQNLCQCLVQRIPRLPTRVVGNTRVIAAYPTLIGFAQTGRILNQMDGFTRQLHQPEGQLANFALVAATYIIKGSRFALAQQAEIGVNDVAHVEKIPRDIDVANHDINSFYTSLCNLPGDAG